MRLQAVPALRVIDLNIESASVPGADKEPGIICTGIKGLEVSLDRLADARGDLKQVTSLDRSVLIGKRVKFLGLFSKAIHTSAEPCRMEGPFTKCSDQVI